MRLKTWHLETAVVYAVLITVNLATEANWRGWLGAAAVALTFGHASIASRLGEAEARRAQPSVHCARWLMWYWGGKEVLWIIYFLATGATPALVGCGVFLVHPLWRRWYRSRFPASEVA